MKNLKTLLVFLTFWGGALPVSALELDNLEVDNSDVSTHCPDEFDNPNVAKFWHVDHHNQVVTNKEILQDGKTFTKAEIDCIFNDLADAITIENSEYNSEYKIKIGTMFLYGYRDESIDFSPIANYIEEIGERFLYAPNLKELCIDFKNLNTIKGEFLCCAKSLETFVMLAPNVTTIPDSFLRDAEKLKHCTLTMPQVRTIQEDFLGGATVLEHLDLSGMSKLTRIDRGAMFQCSSLKILDISGMGQLEIVGTYFMLGCDNVEIVNMQGVRPDIVIDGDTPKWIYEKMMKSQSDDVCFKLTAYDIRLNKKKWRVYSSGSRYARGAAWSFSSFDWRHTLDGKIDVPIKTIFSIWGKAWTDRRLGKKARQDLFTKTLNFKINGIKENNSNDQLVKSLDIPFAALIDPEANDDNPFADLPAPDSQQALDRIKGYLLLVPLISSRMS